MNLQIRDPRARELARQLALKRRISMTEAVVEALEAELRREHAIPPLPDRLAAIAHKLKSQGQASGRRLSKEEIDRMWGHD